MSCTRQSRKKTLLLLELTRNKCELSNVKLTISEEATKICQNQSMIIDENLKKYVDLTVLFDLVS
jgi:hypothetical protein